MTSARREEIYDRACRFWADQGLDRLPVNPRALIARNRWGLVSYRRLAELHHIAAADFAAFCCSRDGFTIYNGRNCCIAYNDAVAAAGRRRFTLTHEIAHIALGHLSRPDFSLPWEPEDPETEGEANFFAGCVLAPSVAIRRCGLTAPSLLAAVCAISREAAGRRLAEYRLWRPREADLPVERLLTAYFRSSVRRRADTRAIDIVCDDIGPDGAYGPFAP